MSVKNFVTEMSSGFCSINLVTEMSLSDKNWPIVLSKNFVTEMSLSSRYWGITVFRNSMMVMS